MKPIRTYKRFFQLLHKLRRSGEVSFVLLDSNLRARSTDKRRVNAHTVWCPILWSTTYTTHLSPFQILFRTYFQRENEKRWVCCAYASKAMGIPDDKFKELEAAQWDRPRHLLSLRRRLLKACGLTEISSKYRRKYRHHGDKPLRSPKPRKT